jgi:hypothetical protein
MFDMHKDVGKVDLEKLSVVLGEYASGSADEKVEILKANKDLFGQSALLTRAVMREGLPFWAKTTGNLSENAVVDKVVMAKDIVLAGVAGLAIWKAGVTAYRYIFG